MTPRAKIYIACVLTVAAGVLLTCFTESQPTAGGAFWIYLLASMVAAALKVNLPGLPNTMSAGFLLLLAAIVQLPRAEVVIVAAASALVQCLWRPKRRPSAVQVAFSTATLVISAAFAQEASQALAEMASLSIVSVIVVAAFLLYTTNTLLVAAVVSLVESRPLRMVWQQCHLWAFPYFICGAILLDVTAALNPAVTWRQVLLLLPLMLLVHVNYRILARRITEFGDASIANT